MEEKIVKARIFRSNPQEGEEGGFVTFEVPVREGMSVWHVLEYITDKLDGGLAYYVSCRSGSCNGCLVKVNGKSRLACTTPINGDLTIEPVSHKRLVKDLLVK